MPRFYVGYAEGEKEIWHAANTSVEANFLITIDPAPLQDPRFMERYKAALLALCKDAPQRRQLTSHTWVFKLDVRLNEVMQIMVDHFGVEQHGFTAVNLDSGEGLSFNPEQRVVCEFYAKNWMA